MFLEAAFLLAVSMSPSPSLHADLVSLSSPQRHAVSASTKRCASASSVARRSLSALQSSPCDQAIAAYNVAYEEYYWALNNTQAASQTYNQCIAYGWGDCSAWYDNMITWSNYLGTTEIALMYATVEVWIACGET